MARTNSVPGRVLEDVAARTACIASRANKAARMHPGQASSRRAPMTADPARTTYALIEWSTCATTRRECAERFCCPRATTVWRRERFWRHDHRGVDGTERSRDALALAHLLALAVGGRLLIAHVHDYGQLEGLLSGGEYETLVRQVAESTAAGVRELLRGSAGARHAACSGPLAGGGPAGLRAARGGIADRRGVVSPLFRGPRAARRGGPAAACGGAGRGRDRSFGLRGTRAATGYRALRVRRVR
jgi:hypothetical protein